MLGHVGPANRLFNDLDQCSTDYLLRIVGLALRGELWAIYQRPSPLDGADPSYFSQATYLSFDIRAREMTRSSTPANDANYSRILYSIVNK